MKIRIVGCDGGLAPGMLTTCFQVNETMLIDAGSAASGLELPDQKCIEDIFLSHIHIDHVKDLAFLADNMVGESETVRIHALPEVNNALRKFYFNGQLWPDFTKIPSPQKPFYKLIDIEAEREYPMGDVIVKPVKVNHAVPCVGFILIEKDKAVVISSDTGPTERLWSLAKKIEHVKGFICEVAFPNDSQVIADEAKHFTPRTLKEELNKFHIPGVPISLYHLKPRFIEAIKSEVRTIGCADFKFLKNGEVLQY